MRINSAIRMFNNTIIMPTLIAGHWATCHWVYRGIQRWIHCQRHLGSDKRDKTTGMATVGQHEASYSCFQHELSGAQVRHNDEKGSSKYMKICWISTSHVFLIDYMQYAVDSSRKLTHMTNTTEKQKSKQKLRCWKGLTQVPREFPSPSQGKLRSQLLWSKLLYLLGLLRQRAMIKSSNCALCTFSLLVVHVNLSWYKYYSTYFRCFTNHLSTSTPCDQFQIPCKYLQRCVIYNSH